MNDILGTLNELNSAWRDRRFEELGRFFDADIILKGPGLKELVRGREALIQSYTDFMGQSKIVDYVESDHSAQVLGQCWRGHIQLDYDMLRIVQECLTNVHRHAGSSTQQFALFKRTHTYEWKLKIVGWVFQGKSSSRLRPSRRPVSVFVECGNACAS